MSVKISKLWRNQKFQNLTNTSKLLYIYLATDPNINTVGVTVLNTSLAELQLSITIEELRKSTKELIDNEFIFVKMYDDVIYCIIFDHFNTMPKADSVVNRINKDLKQLPKGLVKKLESLGISSERKVVNFEIPSKDEILEYASSQGYVVNADTFSDFYYSNGERFGKKGKWVDSKGRQVKDWRAKMRLVWFKEENKLVKVDGAPKGFEYFHIQFEGSLAFPDYWKDGKPYSRNLIVTKELQKEYEKRKGNS